MKKEDFTSFKQDFKKALEEVEKKYNISISAGAITYETRVIGVSNFRFKVECNSLETSTNAEEASFKNTCRIYGFKETDYRKSFILTGRTYLLVGFNTRARAYPIVAEEVGSGRRVRIVRESLDFVRKNLQ